MSTSSKNAIVWEWQDETLAWRQYEPHVSNFIEGHSTEAKLNLGPVDANMRHYCIDFISMDQIRFSTGTRRNIRRRLYPQDSVVTRGFVWQFEGDVPGSWQPYMAFFSDRLERGYQNKEEKIDMRREQLAMPYKVNLKKMIQTRVETKRERRIRRVHNPNAERYLYDKGGSNPSGPSASSIYGSPSATGATGGGISGFGTSMFSKTAPSGGYSANGSYTSRMLSSASAAIGSIFRRGSGTSGTDSSTANGPVTRGKVSEAHAHSYRKSSATSSRPPSALNLSTKSTGGLLSSSSGGTTAVGAPDSGVGARRKTITRLPPYGSFTNRSHSKSQKKQTKEREFDHIINPVMKVLSDPPKDEDCCVCMSGIHETSGLVDEKRSVPLQLKCGHMFHKSCLKAMYDSGAKDECIQCPTCKTIYGVKRGICPDGTMTYDTLTNSLPGHPDCDTIRVMYDVKPGTQGSEHPNPGQRYHTQGFPRIAYLPNNGQGQRVLKLLIKAWERRLTFTVGTSSTTGAQNVVIWNGIHHKTEMYDHSGHGYPAPNFLENVKLECAALGVVESEGEESSEEEIDMETEIREESESDDSDL